LHTIVTPTKVGVQLWQTVVPDLRYVICIRNPLEVAHSIGARDGFALPRAIDLWLATPVQPLPSPRAGRAYLPFTATISLTLRPRSDALRISAACARPMILPHFHSS
jgi:hypothetical protein